MAQKNNTLLGCIYIRTGIDRDFQFFPSKNGKMRNYDFKIKMLTGKRLNILDAASSQVSTTLAP